MAIDYSTLVGQVRLLIADVNEADQLFTDAQISGFLALESDNVYFAAASALNAIVNDRALLFKAVVRSDDQTIDANGMTRILMENADRLRSMAKVKGAESVGFSINGGEEWLSGTAIA